RSYERNGEAMAIDAADPRASVVSSAVILNMSGLPPEEGPSAAGGPDASWRHPLVGERRGLRIRQRRLQVRQNLRRSTSLRMRDGIQRRILTHSRVCCAHAPTGGAGELARVASSRSSWSVSAARNPVLDGRRGTLSERAGCRVAASRNRSAG